MGGSKENRHTPGLEHWSIAVKDGKALEKQWRTETPIPRGGPHRSGDCPGLYNSVHILFGHLKTFIPFKFHDGENVFFFFFFQSFLLLALKGKHKKSK
jgi:hypothetical protein